MFLLWILRQENKTHNQNQSVFCRIRSWERGCDSTPAFEEDAMIEANRVKYLRVALMAVGVVAGGQAAGKKALSEKIFETWPF
jgi:hypothetical protein